MRDPFRFLSVRPRCGEVPLLMSLPNSVNAYRARRFPARFERTRDGRAVTISTNACIKATFESSSSKATFESSPRCSLTSCRVNQRGITPSGPCTKIAPHVRQTARDSLIDRHLHFGSPQRGQAKTTDARSARSRSSGPGVLRGRPPLRPLCRAAFLFAAEDRVTPIRPSSAATAGVNDVLWALGFHSSPHPNPSAGFFRPIKRQDQPPIGPGRCAITCSLSYGSDRC
jgi:hypothetical protein